MLVDSHNKIIPLSDRYEKLKILAKSILKPSHSNTRIKVREVVDLAQCEELIFSKLEHKRHKYQNSQLKYGIPVPFDSQHDDNFIYMRGLHIFKNVASPWSIVLSRRTQMKYYYNSETRGSAYELPLDLAFYSHPKWDALNNEV